MIFFINLGKSKEQKMKHIILVLVAALALFSCSEPDNGGIGGGWNPIEIDYPTLNFTAKGGEMIVTSLNYNGWWIAYGYESKSFVNGYWEYTNIFYATSTDTYKGNPNDLLDGGWYHVSIPKSKPRTVIVTVDANDSSKPRQATVCMSVGDAFGDFEIHQEAQ